MRWKAAVFDMDGTVLDTAEDLTDALNYALEQAGHRHDFTAGEVSCFAGGGVGNTVLRALARENGAPLEDMEFIGTAQGAEVEARCVRPELKAQAQAILPVFRAYYAAHCNVKTGPYAGILELIAALRTAGIRTAVVSNKPDPAVRELAGAKFAGMFECCIGEREGVPRKPSPDMVLAALRELGITDPKDAVYIGDSEVDLQTAANSGMACLAVAWGFRGQEFLAAHGAQIIARTPDEAAAILLS